MDVPQPSGSLSAAPTAPRRESELETFLADRRGRDDIGYVAVVGLDRFTALRKRLGPALTRTVLDAVTARVCRSPLGAQLGRSGRSLIEFGFVARDDEHARAVLTSLRSELARPVEIEEQRVDFAPAIGFVRVGDASEGVTDLIERAEMALEEAFGARTIVEMFDELQLEQFAHKLALFRELREAVQGGELFLLYQPKLNSRSNTIGSAEALVRWNSPTRGIVGPDDFIGLAEETGLIRPLTEWVFRQARDDQRRLAAAGRDLVFFINISASLLSDDDFTRWILKELGGNTRIGFEITESAMIADPVRSLHNIRAFASAGIRIAIDDYGSGFSSLAYLKQIPAHELKLDRMFISGLTSSHRDPLLVRSTIDLAHALEMEVTAEGVDSPSTMALLRVMGCDMIQGFLVSRPICAAELQEFLEGWEKAPVFLDRGQGIDLLQRRASNPKSG